MCKIPNKFYRFDFSKASIEQLQATRLDDIIDQHSGSLISNSERLVDVNKY